jgi:hypothetical protein
MYVADCPGMGSEFKGRGRASHEVGVGSFFVSRAAGGYANCLGPDDQEQISAAYGDNALRLRAIQQKFDPDNTFSSATPFPG